MQDYVSPMADPRTDSWSFRALGIASLLAISTAAQAQTPPAPTPPAPSAVPAPVAPPPLATAAPATAAPAPSPPATAPSDPRRAQQPPVPPGAAQPLPAQPVPAQAGPPPPGYAPAPPGYAPAPPGYAPAPPGYAPAPRRAATSPRRYQGPRELSYREGRPVPAGYHVEERYRKGLIGSGAGVFGGVYLLTLLTASTFHEATDDSGFAAAYVPVIGPLIAIGTVGPGPSGGMFLTLSAVAQGTGLGLLIAGLVHKKKVLVRDLAGLRLELRPELGPQRQGLGLHGTF
jgi:hypothetical protein